MPLCGGERTARVRLGIEGPDRANFRKIGSVAGIIMVRAYDGGSLAPGAEAVGGHGVGALRKPKAKASG